MLAIPFLEEPLGGERAEVRDYAERDIPEILIAHQDDPRLHVVMGLDQPPSGAELGRMWELEPRQRTAGAGAHFTILQRGSALCRGQIAVQDLDWEHRRAELGVWVAPQSRGRGLASEALRLLGPWLLASCGLARLEILIEPDNHAMIAAARSAGFKFEGVLRGWLRDGASRVDVTCVSLIPLDLAR
jgi:RimJ/RimL family protein N-acetyltransferase